MLGGGVPDTILPCRGCGQRLRLSRSRYWAKHRCPVCSADVDPLRTKRLWRSLFSSPIAPPNRPQESQLLNPPSTASRLPSPVPQSSSGAGHHAEPARFTSPAPAPPGGAKGPELQAGAWTIRKLASRAWSTRESCTREISLPPTCVESCSDLRQVVIALLRHAALVAPGFVVPVLVPRVRVSLVLDAAGLFREEQDGSVSITVAAGFFHDRLAAHAILAHEVSHYVLSCSGIREPDTTSNERLTDLTMFVIGLGAIFLRGYGSAAKQDYRPRHRLGYLTDVEYEAAEATVRALRRAPAGFLPGEAELLGRRLANVYPDSRVRSRLIGYARQQMPGAPEAEVYR